MEPNPFHPLDRSAWPKPFTTFRDLNRGETFIEYEGSTIFLPIRARIEDEVVEEKIKLRAFMRVEIFPPYLGGHGTREFQFVIRDWELYGPSSLLSKIYYGDPRGRLRDDARPELGWHQAIMTWTLARHYIKYGDEENASLAPVTSETVIDGQTSHNTDEGNLYWSIEENRQEEAKETERREKQTYSVAFYRSEARLREDLVAFAANIAAGSAFVALSPSREVDLPEWLPLKRETHPGGLRVEWHLGKAPMPGSKGRIRSLTQPRSICVAELPPISGLGVDSADFPARITYAANYEVYVEGSRVAEDQMGVAIANGCRSIPPRDVKVAFEKPFSSERFSFHNGRCLGMGELTRADFDRGVKMARAARASSF